MTPHGGGEYQRHPWQGRFVAWQVIEIPRYFGKTKCCAKHPSNESFLLGLHLIFIAHCSRLLFATFPFYPPTSPKDTCYIYAISTS